MKAKALTASLSGILILVIFSIFFIDSVGRPGAYAREALSKDNVESDFDYIHFQSGQNAQIGIIIYPGGLVAAESYADFASLLSQRGFNTFIVRMPLKLAALDPYKADEIINSHPEIQNWILVGHSLGGTMSSRYVDDVRNVQGLVLLAAYPDLSDSLVDNDVNVLSIRGTEDGLVTAEEVQNSLQLLPPTTIIEEIEGGNHALFGDYGKQRGDKDARISYEEQRDQTVELIINFVKKVNNISP